MRWPPSWPPDLRWPAKHLASIRDFGDAGALKPKARAVATVLAELMGRVREQKLLGPVRRQRMLASSEGSERIVLRVKLTEIANAVSDQDDWPELASRHRRAILVNYVKRLVAPPAPVTKVKLETPWWSGLGTGAFSDIKVVEPDAETRLRARFDSLVQELRASARRHGAPPDELEERVAVVRRKHLRMQVRAWAAQARRRYDAGDLEGALARLDRWAELRGQGVPDLWLDLHVRRAKLLERDEAWSEIIAHLAPLAETVVLPVGEADPDGEWESSHRWLRSTLAGARLNTSREGAQRAFETAGRLVEEAPDHDVYWELLADAGTLLGDMAALERAVAHVSGTTKRWIQTRREGLARGLLTRLTTQPPASYARAQRWVGNVVGEWGETARAELHYRRCLEAVPKVARKERARLEAGCLNSLAFLLAEHAGRDRMGEALDYIDRAWKLAKPVENRLAYMVLTRAEVLVRLGRFDDAEAVREQAVKAGASSGLMAEHRRWCARVLASPPGGEVGD